MAFFMNSGRKLAVDSVQYGSISMAKGGAITASQTITSVDTTRSVVITLGNTADTTVGGEMSCYFTLDNATTVTAHKNSTGSTNIVGYFAVLTFAASAIKTIQTGTILITATATSGTLTITSVNTTKTAILWAGTIVGGDNNAYDIMTGLSLTNSTTVTAYRYLAQAGASTTVAFSVVQFN